MVIKMNDKVLKPALRFKGFTDTWEQHEFKEIFNYERPDMYIVSNEEYSNTYSVPVLTANKGFILGYTNERRTYDKPCIIFDDFTLDSKYVDFPFMVKSSAMKILTNKEGFDLKFSHELLNSVKIENLGHARHYISVVQPTTVRAPKLAEQKEISTLFHSIDSLITLHQRKYDKLVNVKKALLDKMFPKNGEVVPKLRFKGFADAWEQRNIRDLGKVFIGLVTTMTSNYTNSGTLLIRNSDIKENRFEFSDNPIFLESKFALDKSSRMLQIGDVVTVHTGDVGTSAVISAKEENSIGFATINTRPKKEIVHPEYLSCYFNSDIHKNFAINMSTGDGRTNYNLKEFNQVNVPLPSLAEQKKISALIFNVNYLITLHQRKYEKLINIKKALLQKMFV